MAMYLPCGHLRLIEQSDKFITFSGTQTAALMCFHAWFEYFVTEIESPVCVDKLIEHWTCKQTVACLSSDLDLSYIYQ